MKFLIKLKKYLFLKKEFNKEFEIFKKDIKISRGFKVEKHKFFTDKFRKSDFDSHYFYHPIWAFKKIIQSKPKKHIDISSINYFSGFLSCFVNCEYYEFRLFPIILENLKIGTLNLINLPFETDSVDSLSCMHTVEHVGLGRYGDKIDSDGDLIAIKELKRVISKGGSLYFVVPVGSPKIQFNAHRIYSTQMVLEFFSDFQLLEFSLVTDLGEFIENAKLDLGDHQNYGCGCFHFKKM